MSWFQCIFFENVEFSGAGSNLSQSSLPTTTPPASPNVALTTVTPPNRLEVIPRWAVIHLNFLFLKSDYFFIRNRHQWVGVMNATYEAIWGEKAMPEFVCGRFPGKFWLQKKYCFLSEVLVGRPLFRIVYRRQLCQLMVWHVHIPMNRIFNTLLVVKGLLGWQRKLSYWVNS